MCMLGLGGEEISEKDKREESAVGYKTSQIVEKSGETVREWREKGIGIRRNRRNIGEEEVSDICYEEGGIVKQKTM